MFVLFDGDGVVERARRGIGTVFQSAVADIDDLEELGVFSRLRRDQPVLLLDALAKSFPDQPRALLKKCLDGGDIIVNGKPEYLQRERTTDWIRTLLLAGIRSATLWSQLGGGRFELMFGRKKIRKDAETFLAG